MCGRYLIDKEDPVFAELPGKKGEILPSDSACVYLREGKIRSCVKQWGFEMRDRHLLINARSETAASKQMFSTLLQSKRLLVPASLYYEYDAEKTKHSLGIRGNRIYMAGLYNEGRFVILTKDAASGVRFIHDRMPVILDHDTAMKWLDNSCSPESIFGMASSPEVLV